jgi:protein-S-isoprenylcysteine O-methyltransferase Ste14
MSRWLVALVFLAIAAGNGAVALGAVQDAVAGPGVKTAAAAGYAALKFGVVLAFTVFVFVRKPVRCPARDPVSFAACAAALTAVALLRGPSESASTGLVVAGDLIALAAGLWLLVSVLTLGRCFGILPEARGLVTNGPYRIVRHPVYLGELGAAVGLFVAAPTGWNLVVLIAFTVAQAVRMGLEERALGEEFPEYAAYAERTPRLVPAFRGWERRIPNRPTTAWRAQP